MESHLLPEKDGEDRRQRSIARGNFLPHSLYPSEFSPFFSPSFFSSVWNTREPEFHSQKWENGRDPVFGADRDFASLPFSQLNGNQGSVKTHNGQGASLDFAGGADINLPLQMWRKVIAGRSRYTVDLYYTVLRSNGTCLRNTAYNSSLCLWFCEC